MNDKFDKRMTFWAAVATILAAMAAITGFSIFDKIYIFRGGADSSKYSISSDLGNIPSNSGHDGPTKQACDKLAKEIADNITQGFILSAERAQSMRSDLRCDQRGQP